MSNIILQSAENSSLLQTLNQSASKVIPSIYSTKEIYAPSATTWYSNLEPQTASYNAGGVCNWILPKYGFLQQILLSYTKTANYAVGVPGTANAEIPYGDIFNVIDRIEFLSSSRVISTLYAEDLMAQFSDLANDQLEPIYNTALKNVIGPVGAGGVSNVSTTYVVPIVFGFNRDINTVQNLSFNEPTSLRVVWRGEGGSIVSTQGSSPVIVAGLSPTRTISNANIMLRYKLYSEADNAELLTQNYNEPQLNQLTSRFMRENPFQDAVMAAAAAAPGHTARIVLRNVDVIKAFYIMVRAETDITDVNDTSPNDLVNITSITLTASGQELCSLNFAQNYYSRLTENGHAIQGNVSGTVTTPVSGGTTIFTRPMSLAGVFKVQTGLWENAGGGAWSNGWSARELNNLLLEVVFDKPVNRICTCYVEQETATILSTSSNTGRVVNSLVN